MYIKTLRILKNVKIKNNTIKNRLSTIIEKVMIVSSVLRNDKSEWSWQNIEKGEWHTKKNNNGIYLHGGTRPKCILSDRVFFYFFVWILFSLSLLWILFCCWCTYAACRCVCLIVQHTRNQRSQCHLALRRIRNLGQKRQRKIFFCLPFLLLMMLWLLLLPIASCALN